MLHLVLVPSYVAGKKRRITFVECPPDLHGMLDAAKYADLVLLLVRPPPCPSVHHSCASICKGYTVILCVQRTKCRVTGTAMITTQLPP
jgi:hypothetical protein